MSFVPATVNLTDTNQILQGATYVRVFQLKVNGSPQDMTAYDAVPPRCQFRASETSGTIVITPTCAWTSAATGQFSMTIAASVTEAFTHPPAVSSGQYDVEVVADAGGAVERVMQGTWTIYREITQ